MEIKDIILFLENSDDLDMAIDSIKRLGKMKEMISLLSVDIKKALLSQLFIING